MKVTKEHVDNVLDYWTARAVAAEAELASVRGERDAALSVANRWDAWAAEAVAKLQSAEAELASVRGELVIANARGDGWRRLYDEDTAKRLAARARVAQLEAALQGFLDEAEGGDLFINGVPDEQYDRLRRALLASQPLPSEPEEQ